MKIYKIIQALSIIIILQSCAGSINITEINQKAENAYQAGNYEAALNSWEQIIESRESKGKKAEGEIYISAAKSAISLEQMDKARKYLETAKEMGFSSPELYVSLAKVYKTIDNLSKEITALETYREKYPNGNKINQISTRLFETYVESENWNPAIALWPDIEEQAKTNTELLAGYLIVNKNLDKTSTCDKIANQILKIDSKNITALEWYADKYFWRAENLYVTEMKAYKNHRTTSQYNKLLKALDKVWPNYQKSRDYYLKLYKIDPKPKYAKYLANIYTRYEDKEKAAYYSKLAK